MFEKHEVGDLINPDIVLFFTATTCFKQMKPLVKEFFRILQGLSKMEMEKGASHNLHVEPSAK